jgi:hypothetical protein
MKFRLIQIKISFEISSSWGFQGEETWHVYAHPWLDALWEVEFMSVSSSLAWSGGDYSQNYIDEKFHSYWQTTKYSGLPAVGQTSHVLTHPISLIQSQFILKCVMLFGTTACQSQLKISLKPSTGQDHWRHIHAFRGAQVWLLLTLQQSVSDQTTYLWPCGSLTSQAWEVTIFPFPSVASPIFHVITCL